MEQIDLSTEPKGYKLSLKEPIRRWSGGVQELHVSGEVLIIREKEELRLYIKDKQEWNGTGLPPVGTVCERRFPEVEGSSWRQITILFCGDKKVFYRDEAGDEWANLPDDVSFRPIRTPEQIAAEQREKAVQEMVNDCPYPGSATTAIDCLALYKAGYRKFEIVPE